MVGVVGIFDRQDIYEIEIRRELKKLGADENDLSLVTSELVLNNFSKRRLPSDVAWAIMQ